MRTAGIVVVTYNSAAPIEECLQAASRLGAPIVVVDNASQDDTCRLVRRFPNVRLIANRRNRGFGAAANQGIAALETPFVLLLNPDAILLSGIEALVEALQLPATAAAGGKLVDQRLRPQTGFSVRRFPTPSALAFEALGWNRLWKANPVNRRYRCLDLNLDSPAEVEQPAGAFLMLRRDAWLEAGGFDEEFHPLWFEDVDLLRRLVDRGYTIRYVPSAVARHQGAHSLERIPANHRQIYWYASLLRYAAKHFRARAYRAICAAVMAGMVPRVVLGILTERSLAPLVAGGHVVRLAGRCILSDASGKAGRSLPVRSG